MIEGRLITALSALRVAPTVDDWELVLSGAISGALEDALDRIGGIEDFVHTTIANASDPSLSRHAFRAALENLVSAWQPGAPAPLTEIDRLLRLASAFTPNSGFHKVLGQLERWGRFLPAGDISQSETDDLEALALVALQNYFPVHPADPGAFPAFDTYVEFLKFLASGSGIARSRGHACRRLLELGVWTLDDEFIEQSIDYHFEEVIPSLLSWLLTSGWHGRAALLSRLYGRSLREDSSRALFEEELARLSAQVVDRSEGPFLALASGESIELLLSAEDFQQYLVKVRWGSETVSRGRDTLDAIAMAATRD